MCLGLEIIEGLFLEEIKQVKTISVNVNQFITFKTVSNFKISYNKVFMRFINETSIVYERYAGCSSMEQVIQKIFLFFQLVRSDRSFITNRAVNLNFILETTTCKNTHSVHNLWCCILLPSSNKIKLHLANYKFKFLYYFLMILNKG